MDGPRTEALDRRLTRRETEVLDALAERLTNAQLARRLKVSERTVESHVGSLLRKLGAQRRTDLIGVSGYDVRHRSSPARIPYQLEALAQRSECFGRDDERRRLAACWDRSASGVTMAVIRGEAGIGKSRLAAAVAAEVVEQGGRVMLGRCLDGPQRPYEPLLAPIADELARLSDHEVRRQAGAWGISLAPVSPEVAARLEVDRHEVVDPEHERAAVHVALHEFVCQAARRHRLLLVIEDLHWASSATLDAIAQVVRVGGDPPLMLLVTTRDEGRSLTDGLGAFFGRVETLSSVEMVSLAGLDVAAAAMVIDEAGGDLDSAEACSQTGGNPLFLRELAREGQGSRSLRELVNARFGQCSPTDLEVLDMAAIAGEQIDVPLIRAALDRTTDDVLDALERAEAIGLVGAGAAPGQFAFTHDVFRSVRVASMTASRKMRLHAAAARALERHAVDDRDIAERARHACLAGLRFDPVAAAGLALRAGDAALRATDYGEAAEHYRRAVMALDLVAGLDEAARLDAAIRLGAALVLVGDPEGRRVLEEAGRVAQARSDPVALARAVCAIPVPGSSTTIGVPDTAFRAMAEAALDALPPAEGLWRIRILALLGIQLLMTDAPDGGDQLIRSALAAARDLDDRVAIGRVLMTYRFCGGPMNLEERIACGRELVELGESLGIGIFSFMGCQQLCWCYRELGDRNAMDRWYAEAAARTHTPDAELLSQLPAVSLMDGDLARAEQLTDELSSLWDAAGIGLGYSILLRSAIADCRGDLPNPADLQAALEAGDNFAAILEPALARTWIRTGQADRAAELLNRARRRGFSIGYSVRGGAVSASHWAEVAVSLGDTESAQQLGILFEPLAGRMMDAGACVWDTIDRIRALLRIATGDPAAAAAIATAAVVASRRRQTPILLARELIVLAFARQELGDPATEELVEEALTIARRTGARLIVHDARLYLSAPTASGPPDQFGLTRREREIVDLVASGATNTQVATALAISPATVRKHLEHAYEKLGVSTRTAAAARIAEDQLRPPRGVGGN